MVLPSKDSFQLYGGEKTDFISVVDPTTDRSADEVNAALASLSALTRTGIRAFVTFPTSAAGTNPVPSRHESVWGNSIAVMPTIVHSATGIYDITWSASIVDVLGENQSLNFQFVTASADSDSYLACTVKLLSPNSVSVRLFDSAATLADAVGNNITVAVC